MAHGTVFEGHEWEWGFRKRRILRILEKGGQ